MKEQAYKITLTPKNVYFFGGEKNFGSDNQAPQNYLVNSNFLPQQSAVLGLCRYLLLTNSPKAFDLKNNSIIDTNEAENLIGKKGFRYPSPLNGFGKISRLSPLFLAQNGELIFQPALHAGHSLERQTGGGYVLGGEKENGEGSMEQRPAFLLKDKEGKVFNAKNGLNQKRMISEKGVSYSYLQSPEAKDPFIFTQHEQVGILKNRRQEEEGEDEQGFFKQSFFGLKKGLGFCFYLKLTDDLLKEGKLLVPFGGEGKTFLTHIEKADSFPEKLNYPSAALPLDDLPKLVLLSEAFVEGEKLRAASPFILGNTQDARFLQTSVHTENFYSLRSGKAPTSGLDEGLQNHVYRSKKFQLLSRGAVIYLNKGEDSLKSVLGLLNDPTLQAVGFNHFLMPGKEMTFFGLGSQDAAQSAN